MRIQRKQSRASIYKLCGIAAIVIVCFGLGRFGASSGPAKMPAAEFAVRGDESPSSGRVVKPSASMRTPAPLPTEGSPLATNYAELSRRTASGDSQAAMRLFSDLEQCQARRGKIGVVDAFAFRSRRRDESESNPESVVPDPLVSLTKQTLDELESTDALCQGVTEQQIDQRGEALRSAAIAGDTEAMVCYAGSTEYFGPPYLSNAWFDYARRWTSEAPEFAERAFDAGQADVIPLLIDAFTPVDPSARKTSQFSELIAPDHRNAYALALLYQKLVPASESENVNSQILYLRRGLSVDELGSAQVMADALWPRFAASAGNPVNLTPCSRYTPKLASD